MVFISSRVKCIINSLLSRVGGKVFHCKAWMWVRCCIWLGKGGMHGRNDNEETVSMTLSEEDIYFITSCIIGRRIES